MVISVKEFGDITGPALCLCTYMLECNEAEEQIDAKWSIGRGVVTIPCTACEGRYISCLFKEFNQTGNKPPSKCDGNGIRW